MRCGRRLLNATRVSLDSSLALCTAAFVLLVAAVALPQLIVTHFGTERHGALITGSAALFKDGFPSLAALVFIFSIALPLVYLGLMTAVLVGVRTRATIPRGIVLRLAERLRPWLMMDVYLMGCGIAYKRLIAVGAVTLGEGAGCLILGTIILFLFVATLDTRAAWTRVPRRSAAPVGTLGVNCELCELNIDDAAEHSSCPRCGHTLTRRKPAAFARTAALVIAGAILYIPAIMLPVLSIEQFGHHQRSTILSGVGQLITAGLVPLAVIVFTASIVVPLLKLASLTLMLVMTYRRSRRWLVGRTRLYRAVDRIGRWSNIDIFTIAVLAALVQFGTLATVRPEPGAVAFAAVVVITMLASRSFDSRLMWDAAEGQP